MELRDLYVPVLSQLLRCLSCGKMSLFSYLPGDLLGTAVPRRFPRNAIAKLVRFYPSVKYPRKLFRFFIVVLYLCRYISTKSTNVNLCIYFFISCCTTLFSSQLNQKNFKKIPDLISKSGILGNFFNISLNFHMTNIVRIENK